MNSEIVHKRTYSFLQDAGETGRLILQHDWMHTSIGGIDTWPLSLRTTLGNLLHTAFPMFLFWGKDLICFYNDAYRPSLGEEGKHPAIGKKGKNVWPEIWDFIGPLIQQVLTTGKPSWFEDQLVPIVRNGGLEDVYWTFSYSPAYDDSGQINGVLVTCMETTEMVLARKKIEETVARRTEELKNAHASLLEANNYLQTIINLFQEPLQVLEPVMENGEVVDFRFKLTNQSYAVYAGTTPEQLKGKRVGDVFPGYFATSSFSKNVDVYKTGKPDSWEIHYDKDGLDLYNLMSACKLEEELVVHFTDFTKLKHLQLQLENKVKELERSNQQLEEVAYAASHDLKEPIRKIHVFAGRLKEQISGRLSQQELDIFEKIETASSRMIRLIDDVMKYSHVTSRPIAKEPVSLNELLQLVQEDLELDIQQKTAIIRLENLPLIYGYPRQLQQLFQNLLTNALKYSRTGVPPLITISAHWVTENDLPYCLVNIKDNGIGFEPQYANKIFQMFSRLHGKNDYSGTGIGLSIVKKVVENHGGFVRATSTPGEGSTFHVFLPGQAPDAGG